MFTNKRTIKATVLAIAAAGTMLAGTVASHTASADTEWGGHVGYVGTHYLRDYVNYDGSVTAGTACNYNSANTLYKITAYAPVVYGRTPDSQYVGYTAYLQAQRSDGTWFNATNGPLSYALASVTTAASLPTQSFSSPSPARAYRVIIRMYWFDPATGSEQGHADHKVDYYAKYQYGSLGQLLSQSASSTLCAYQR